VPRFSGELLKWEFVAQVFEWQWDVENFAQRGNCDFYLGKGRSTVQSDSRPIRLDGSIRLFRYDDDYTCRRDWVHDADLDLGFLVCFRVDLSSPEETARV
jgi:hypothetical protein